MTVCTHRFQGLAEIERATLGMPDLALAVAQHPIGGLDAGAVRLRATGLVESVVVGLTHPSK
ncbi:MAG: hypothetical protein HY681_09550 [Chloroflexi bacterium]|nr:hypothetical protein [Chloroflexota bacterium]